MADYSTQAVPGTKPFGNVNLLYRNDTAGDLGAANAALAPQQGDSAGSLRTTAEGGKPTYSVVSQFASDSTGTDIWFIQGSSTKTVKVLKIIISGTITAAATGDLSVIRRSAANTAGTAVADTPGLLDATNDVAATSVVKHYTAHPTGLGTAVATLFGVRLGLPTSPAVAGPIEINFANLPGGKLPRLSGTTDFLCINIAAALGGAGNAYDITCFFTEEPTTA